MPTEGRISASMGDASVALDVFRGFVSAIEFKIYYVHLLSPFLCLPSQLRLKKHSQLVDSWDIVLCEYSASTSTLVVSTPRSGGALLFTRRVLKTIPRKKSFGRRAFRFDMILKGNLIVSFSARKTDPRCLFPLNFSVSPPYMSLTTYSAANIRDYNAWLAVLQRTATQHDLDARSSSFVGALRELYRNGSSDGGGSDIVSRGDDEGQIDTEYDGMQAGYYEASRQQLLATNLNLLEDGEAIHDTAPRALAKMGAVTGDILWVACRQPRRDQEVEAHLLHCGLGGFLSLFHTEGIGTARSALRSSNVTDEFLTMKIGMKKAHISKFRRALALLEPSPEYSVELFGCGSKHGVVHGVPEISISQVAFIENNGDAGDIENGVDYDTFYPGSHVEVDFGGVPSLARIIDDSLAGKCCIVTGAHRALGLSFVEHLRDRGATVIATAPEAAFKVTLEDNYSSDSNNKPLARIKELVAMSPLVSLQELDVGNDESVCAFAQHLLNNGKSKPTFDIVINASAPPIPDRSEASDILGTTSAQLLQTLRIQCAGFLTMAKEFCPLLRKNEHGLASIIVDVLIRENEACTVANEAASTISTIVSQKFQPHGIGVMTISPVADSESTKSDLHSPPPLLRDMGSFFRTLSTFSMADSGRRFEYIFDGFLQRR